MFVFRLKVLVNATLLLLIAYSPMFVLGFVFKHRPAVLIPFIIAASLTMALISIAFFLRKGWTGRAFGFSWPSNRFIGLALIIGVPSALAVTYIGHFFETTSPFGDFAFKPWMIFLYFIIGAAIQEEVIFRGLIQSYLAKKKYDVRLWRLPISCAVVISALLFGLLHLEVGVATAVGALILSLVAGELRNRSGSLIPAMIVHSLFNLSSLIW